jgi:23S rRNA (uracil1939-C5)-methyltransferase
LGIKKGQIIDVEIEDLAFGGRGVTRVDGMAIFVDQVAPMDYARIRIIRKRRKYAEAILLELLKPSPFRVTPPCPYSGVCGGCKWQFLNYDKQLEYKRRQVAEALIRIGELDYIKVQQTIPSDGIFNYRNKMEFTFSDRRWLMPEELGKPNVDVGMALGLHVPGTFFKVLDTEACLLQPALGNAILEQVREFVKASDQPIYGLKSHQGFWRFLMLRHSVAADVWMVNIITAADHRAMLMPLVDQLMKTHPSIVSVVNNVTARRAGITLGESEFLLGGDPFIIDQIGPFEFNISANSFFQTNTVGAEHLYQTVLDFAGLKGGERVIDLYSGTGTIAICLSSKASEVIGIEIVESAVTDALKNCDRNKVSNCHFIHGDIANELLHITTPADVVIIDPPRAGMHKNVLRQVLDMTPERIVYVSCNPSTLARDLGLMKEVYRVLEVQPVDMFPHTYHIEVVVKLEKI